MIRLRLWAACLAEVRPKSPGEASQGPVGMALELIEIGHVEAAKAKLSAKRAKARKDVVGADLNRPAEKTNFTHFLQPHEDQPVTALAERVNNEHGDMSFTLRRAMLQTRKWLRSRLQMPASDDSR